MAHAEEDSLGGEKKKVSLLEGFKVFLLRGNVIDLAIAVVIGAAFTNIVNAFVKGVVNPQQIRDVLVSQRSGPAGEGRDQEPGRGHDE